MIEAIIFDLDGTLVQTEVLKAISYARAAVKMAPGRIRESQVLDAFKEVVGLPRREVAKRLIQVFDLEQLAASRMEELQVDSPWQAFVQVRLEIYESMLQNPGILHQHECPFNLALLKWAHQNNYFTGLATMSHCPQAQRVLDILELKRYLNFVATRDDVENGKPHPEIYLLVAAELNVAPASCLVIEDSPSGIKAAISAGMGCIAVTNAYTREQVRRSGLLPPRWIVDDPAKLHQTAGEFIWEHQAASSSQ